MKSPLARRVSTPQKGRDLLAPLALRLGFTAILVAYFLVWLPQPVAGLSFIGLEMGEWVKFLPQIRSGEIVPVRDLYYLPPITLGLMIALWTADWPNRRWQSWAARAVAVGVAFLSFPAIEAILEEAPDQWALRLQLILLVLLVTVLSSQFHRLPESLSFTLSWLLIVLIALLGATLPTWAYLAMQPAFGQLLGSDVGIGPGVWLNAIGHFVIVGIGLFVLLDQRMRDNGSGS